MKEFMLLFKADYKKMEFSQVEWQTTAKKWHDWTSGIEAKGKWGGAGKQLGQNSKIVRANGIITDGPYLEIKEMLISYCTVKAESIEDAAELAKNCPVLDVGGNVEVRELVKYDAA